MRVLFLGADSGTSRHRYHAFRRLGHSVALLDPRAFLPGSTLFDSIEWKLHPGLLTPWVRRRVLQALGGERFDLAFVESGSLVGPGLVNDLKRRCGRVVNFNHDDPFGSRDGARFAAYRSAVPCYDLVVVVRQENIVEAKSAGARRVLHSFMVADEVAHAPRELTPECRAKWSSEVAFVGTWMPERGLFLARLKSLGVPLSIFGDGWDRAPESRQLHSCLREPRLDSEEYCKAVQSAEICLGLVSAGNRDLHTTRSMEIPALGSLLCAQRTREHESLYRDGVEAVFWDSADECARHCAELLQNPERRRELARAGRRRCLANGHFTGPLLKRIIDEAFA